tara:strand:- start:85 stop:507 length:423 start_codon:yes stop_codon:yes gene_type:complete
MKEFKEFIKQNKVLKKKPDPAQARSLFLQAQERMQDLLTLPLKEKNASFRFEDAYEVLREALHSFLAKEGYKPYSHEAVFAFACENSLVSKEDAHKADRFREIRNDINYRAKRVTIEETKEIIEFVKRILSVLEKKHKTN